jgi:hypothetical protein
VIFTLRQRILGIFIFPGSSLLSAIELIKRFPTHNKAPCFQQFTPSLVAAVSTKAVAAVNGPITAGAEGDLGFLATLRTGSRMHFPPLLLIATATTAAETASGVLLFAGRPAIGAAARLISKTLFGKEILF